MSLNSIVSRGDLIGKIRIPRWIIVFSACITAIIIVGFNFLIVVVFMFINKVDLLQTSLLLPFLLLELYVFALGVSLILATAFVKYRDIGHVWDVVLQGLFYLTPILYPLSYVVDHASTTIAKLIMLNPVAQIIQDIRYVLITHKTQTISDVYGTSLARLITIGMCVLVLYLGLIYFRKEAKNFAEEL